MSKRSKRWSAYEKFKLLRYSSEGVEELKNEINRTEIAIQSMARKLNMGKCYVKQKEEITFTKFCNDCIYNYKTCNNDPEDCLKKAKLYKKFALLYSKEK